MHLRAEEIVWTDFTFQVWSKSAVSVLYLITQSPESVQLLCKYGTTDKKRLHVIKIRRLLLRSYSVKAPVYWSAVLRTSTPWCWSNVDVRRAIVSWKQQKQRGMWLDFLFFFFFFCAGPETCGLLLSTLVRSLCPLTIGALVQRLKSRDVRF